ncbi:PREDICTED: small proline-rich protein 2B-like [Cyphomyrmex costatus]|uniref:Uncharacterized protein n=1 Tax=Cyphomyrmex costatus TaxID=456900 RepID=A0A195D389_9HYME|nr:PREDICTED: small proline-rich protein 2B-like [Cyphomyrmex costatus]XP_018405989.1 PREDICTED: small proline-rich protein 2B-like [Cyphomyrmex costatus]XP_018405991.1 PREDICTED: small proline-rich protein 2B-like [Cyphomyrmex costatus]KYN07362.1 hypothetical protein ALC62_01564 [Cyphomyrmex costatus]
MSCSTGYKKKKRLSTLPPPCYHRKPFCCTSNGCLFPGPSLPKYCHCPPSCPPLICRPRPELPPLPPTICIAGPCPQQTASKSYCSPSAPKILPPSSCVRFCIRYTNKGSSCYPCYWSNLPKCPSNIC